MITPRNVIALAAACALSLPPAVLPAQLRPPGDLSTVQPAPANRTTPTVFGPAPAGVVAGATLPTAVHVTWQAAEGASSYHVYRGKTAEGPWSQVTAQPITGTSYTDAGVSPHLQVFYKVHALHEGKMPGTSPVATVRTPNAHPTGFKAQETSPGTVVLSWNAMAGAAEYWVAGPGVGQVVKGTNLTLTWVTPGPKTYQLVAYYNVAPFGRIEGGDLTAGLPTATVTVTPKPLAPAPANLAMQQLGPDKLRLTWSKATGASHYRVIHKAGAMELPQATSIDIAGLKPGDQYTFRVAAVFPVTTADGSPGYLAGHEAILNHRMGKPIGVKAEIARSTSNYDKAFYYLTAATNSSVFMNVSWDNNTGATERYLERAPLSAPTAFARFNGGVIHPSNEKTLLIWSTDNVNDTRQKVTLECMGMIYRPVNSFQGVPVPGDPFMMPCREPLPVMEATATAVANGVAISISYPQNPTRFEIWRIEKESYCSQGEGTKVATLSTQQRSFIDETALPGRSYCYSVAGYFAGEQWHMGDSRSSYNAMRVKR